MKVEIGVVWLSILFASGAAQSQTYVKSRQAWPGPAVQTIDAAGKNAVVLSDRVDGATIGPVAVTNAFRAVETRNEAAVISNLRIVGLTGTDIQRECIRLRGQVTNVLLDNVDCRMRSAPQTSPNLPIGLHVESGSGITIQNSSFSGFQMTGAPGTYWNGDGIAVEGGVTDFRIVNVRADDNMDAGFDLKSSGWLDNVSASNNARNYRIWNGMRIGTITVGDSLKRGGTASPSGFWIRGSAAVPVVEIDRLVVRMTRPGVIFRIDDGPIDLRIGTCDIQAPAGTVFIASESKSTRTRLGTGCPAG